MSLGIEQVWANGVVSFAEGKATGAKPGRLVTRGR
jgi:N-acyl-D-amino-acid deacylase